MDEGIIEIPNPFRQPNEIGLDNKALSTLIQNEFSLKDINYMLRRSISMRKVFYFCNFFGLVKLHYMNIYKYFKNGFLKDLEERNCSPRIPFIRICRQVWEQKGIKANIVTVPIVPEKTLKYVLLKNPILFNLFF